MNDTLFNKLDYFFMQQALNQAKLALKLNEVPIGCVIVNEHNQIIGKGFNLKETLKDPTAHAEIIAIRHAAARLNSWRLNNCTLYVTVEPCPMCAGAIVMARIKRVVYATSDPKTGACSSLYSITSDKRLNHRCIVHSGLLAQQASELLTSFFQSLRAKNKEPT